MNDNSSGNTRELHLVTFPRTWTSILFRLRLVTRTTTTSILFRLRLVTRTTIPSASPTKTGLLTTGHAWTLSCNLPSDLNINSLSSQTCDSNADSSGDKRTRVNSISSPSLWPWTLRPLRSNEDPRHRHGVVQTACVRHRPLLPLHQHLVVPGEQQEAGAEDRRLQRHQRQLLAPSHRHRPQRLAWWQTTGQRLAWWQTTGQRLAWWQTTGQRLAWWQTTGQRRRSATQAEEQWILPWTWK